MCRINLNSVKHIIIVSMLPKSYLIFIQMLLLCNVYSIVKLNSTDYNKKTNGQCLSKYKFIVKICKDHVGILFYIFIKG